MSVTHKVVTTWSITEDGRQTTLINTGKTITLACVGVGGDMTVTEGLVGDEAEISSRATAFLTDPSICPTCKQELPEPPEVPHGVDSEPTPKPVEVGPASGVRSVDASGG